MKLFKQPLDKLFSPKAMKQLSAAINSTHSFSNDSSHSKRKRSSSSASCLRKFSGRDVNNNSNNNNDQDHGSAIDRPTKTFPATTTATTTTTSTASSSSNANVNTLTPGQQRLQLQLSVLPKPVRNLLNELYLRGPDTIGIFRKSPNAKHCKELRHKLEADGQCSIEQFQVTVVASVFKEWLRSLPDCLLMSRLYPQWIDVAKLLEPLYQQQLQRHESQILNDDSYFSDNTMQSGNTSLRPSRSPLTDNGQQQQQQQPLDRARSCSTMSEFAIDRNPDGCERLNSSSSSTSSSSTTSSTGIRTQQAPSMSAFALSERHSECLRIVRQLLDALNEPNLILLTSFVCVLWHIARNSEYNKMSANNLGVCVGQSLLNDEHQSSGKSTGLTFSNRLRRTKSQCLFSSTLSLTSPTLAKNSSYYMSSSNAQETAKYVPMLVSFMIENAPALFGQDITTMFSAQDILRKPVEASENVTSAAKMVSMNSMEQENQQPSTEPSYDQIDCRKLSLMSVDTNNLSSTPIQKAASSKQIVVESKFRPENGQLNSVCIIPNENRVEDDGSTTTSILIVNPPKRLSAAQRLGLTKAQHRPLSVTESTSSSRASSSTSGVHSESPVFSSEADSQNRTTTSSCSPSPSSVSSPSAASSISTSPVQEAQESHLCIKESENRLDSSTTTRELTEPSIADSQSPLIDAELSRYQNRHAMNRYSSPFINVLNRVPKIPVQLTTSSYGGEAIIYNPKPSQSNSLDHYSTVYSPGIINRSNDNVPHDSGISVKPLTYEQTQQQQYHNTLTWDQQELRNRRLNEFLAHQHQHNTLTSAPSLPFLPKSTSHMTRLQSIAQHQQASFGGVTATDNMRNFVQQQQPSIFYSTSNLSTIHQHPQQQGQYMLYQRSSLEPQRSHVMSLRDHYLSLQQQNHQRQQQLQQQQLPTFYSTNNLSSLQQPQQHAQQQEQYMSYHRSSLDPQRSHVMLLRDYYLSVQQQNLQRQQQQQQQHQQQISYRTSRLSYATIRPTSCQKRMCEDAV